MENQWLTLSFPVPSSSIDLIADELYALGCLGINVEERTLDTFIQPDPDDEVPLSYQVQVYFAQDSDPEVLSRQICLLQQNYPEWPHGG